MPPLPKKKTKNEERILMSVCWQTLFGNKPIAAPREAGTRGEADVRVSHVEKKPQKRRFLNRPKLRMSPKCVVCVCGVAA